MVGRPKIDFLKSTEGGTLESAGGQIPEGGGISPHPKSTPDFNAFSNEREITDAN